MYYGHLTYSGKQTHQGNLTDNGNPTRKGNLTHKLTLTYKRHLPDRIWFGLPVYRIILCNSYIAWAVAFSGPWLPLRV